MNSLYKQNIDVTCTQMNIHAWRVNGNELVLMSPKVTVCCIQQFSKMKRHTKRTEVGYKKEDVDDTDDGQLDNVTEPIEELNFCLCRVFRHFDLYEAMLLTSNRFTNNNIINTKCLSCSPEDQCMLEL